MSDASFIAPLPHISCVQRIHSFGFSGYSAACFPQLIIAYAPQKRQVVPAKKREWRSLYINVRKRKKAFQAFDFSKRRDISAFILFEKETDQIQVSGIIEGTAEIDTLTGAKYDTGKDNRSGEIVIVNGKKYYLMSYGDFGVGDHVILHVLPRSGFVLKMEMAEPTSLAEE